MANTLLSPGVSTTEIDRTAVVPAVDVSSAATVGQYTWGPADEIVRIDDENQLVDVFREPNDTNYRDFLTSASYLAYAKGLSVVRVVGTGALNATATASAAGAGQLIKNLDAYIATSFTSSANLWIAKYPGTLGNSIKVAWADSATFDAQDSSGAYTFAYHDQFSSAPGANEFHIIVIDATGLLTGVAGAILERYDFVSSLPGAMRFDGSSNYFKNRINNMSRWIWVGKESLLSGKSNGVTLGGGADGSAVSDANRQAGWALMQNKEDVDATIFFVGGAGLTTGTWVINNVGEYRQDCVVCVSPLETDVVGVASESTALTNVLTTRTSYGSSSYAFMDSNWKYTYDRYNDTYRWIPLNGDIAGLLAKTDDAWQSPAGLNRGRIKGVVKFAWKQSETTQKAMYPKGINPCFIMNGEGPVLYGDRTLLSKPSAFDRIGVRMLFIQLKKAIARAAKYQLFENNTPQTRNDFLGMVNPYLRRIKGKGGVENFRVICDTTNNTPTVITGNEFVGDVYIKPVYSINFIQLNFTAVRSGVDFSEIVVNNNSTATRTVQG